MLLLSGLLCCTLLAEVGRLRFTEASRTFMLCLLLGGAVGRVVLWAAVHAGVSNLLCIM